MPFWVQCSPLLVQAVICVCSYMHIVGILNMDMHVRMDAGCMLDVEICRLDLYAGYGHMYLT